MSVIKGSPGFSRGGRVVAGRKAVSKDLTSEKDAPCFALFLSDVLNAFMHKRLQIKNFCKERSRCLTPLPRRRVFVLCASFGRFRKTRPLGDNHIRMSTLR